MNIKILPCDRVYSQYIRLKDKRCTRCGSMVKLNDKGLPVSHQASHFWGRKNWSVRFHDPNVTCHCHGCHSYLTANPEEHRRWKISQLGQKEYDLLEVRKNQYAKRDEALALLQAKLLLKEIQDGQARKN